MAKTYFVHLNAIVITVRTDGAVETFEFKTKKEAEKKILELIKQGYRFDSRAESNPAPTNDASL